MAQKFVTPITIKQLASAGSDAFTVFLDGEVYGRVRIEAGGRISWSDGAGSYDTNIYRSGANTLSTDDVFKAISGVVTLAVNGVPSAALPDGAIAVDTLNNAFYFRSNSTWTQVTGGGGGATVTVSDTPPASPTEGDLWFESDTAKTHVYYDSFWVEIGASGGVATLDNIGDVTAPTPSNGDFLKWNGTAWVNQSGVVTTGDTATVTSTMIAEGTIVNGDINASAGIALSKLATSTAGNIIVYNSSGVPTAVAETGDITISDTGVTAIASGVIVDADVNASAGIAHSKLANATAGQVLLGTTTTGVVTATTISGDITIDGAGVASIAANSVALGTDTTGNYVQSLVAGTGVTLTNGTASEGGTPTIGIGQAVGTTSNVQFNDVTVDGNLTVNGTTTTLNTDTLSVEDNIIVLNSNITASPTLNAGIEIERGTSANVLVRWNETSDRWEFTNDGSVYTALGGGVAVSDTAPSSPVQGAVWFESDTLKTFVYYDSSWVEIGVTAGVSVLDDLTNVTAPSPTSGQFLKWNGTAWVPDSIPTINALDDIGNVTAPSPSVNDVLQWNGTAWVNSASAGGGLTVSASAPASPSAGDMWFDSDTSKTYVYYDSYWVEVGNIGGTAKVLVSAAPPASPTLGDLWFDSDTAQTFAYYDSSWIEVGATGTAAIISDTAPSSPISGLIWFNSATGQTFTYYDSSWIEIGASGVAASVNTTAPSSPVIGQIWFNSTTGGTYVYYDTVWVEIGAQPLSTIISTIDGKGDILVGSGDNAVTKISAGANGYILTTNSATATGLQWVSRSDASSDFEIASIMGVY